MTRQWVSSSCLKSNEIGLNGKTQKKLDEIRRNDDESMATDRDQMLIGISAFELFGHCQRTNSAIWFTNFH